MKQISIIIPFKNSFHTLPRLVNSIPVDERLEIILVENSDNPHPKEDIDITRDYILKNVCENRYAGGARNVGLDAARGEWVIFADSDDFFADNAFDVFFKYAQSSYDLIYFGCNSVYDDTLKQSDRHLMYQNIVEQYIDGKESEMKTRLYHVVPWAKMIRRSLINENNIRFDEVIASNDIMFATTVGHRSQHFFVDDKVVYIVTTRKGSLAYTWNYQILKARYIVWLRRNQYLKKYQLSIYQVSIMRFLQKALQINLKTLFEFLLLAVKYKQNIFIGVANWFYTAKNLKRTEVKEKKYIIKN